MQPQFLQREPLYRQIYQLIEGQILSNELNIGDALPAEQTLADSLEVHRSSVREALRLLEENGMVGRKPGGKKLYVRRPDRKKLGSRLSNALILEDVSFQQLYEGIRLLEPDIAALAAQNISAKQLSRIAENLRETERNLDNADALLELDFEFHKLVAEATGNCVVELSRLGIVELFYPSVHQLLEKLDVSHRLLQAHRNIYQGLENKDPVFAREWALKHTDDFKRGYELAGLDIQGPVRRVK